ncbi:hypothetical protein [Streptomyces sp. NPDC048442]|uniref:hypothetical protein n=1 Tax=Streptomyces sp. NPDC048442 TaxID=3154823 RepID=UPI00343FB51E
MSVPVYDEEGGQQPHPRSPFSTGRARSRFRPTPLGVLMVAGGLVLGVGTGWLVRDPGEERAVSPPSASASPTARKPAAPTKYPPPAAGSPTAIPATAPTLPPDFAVVRDPSGATLAVPTGWRRDRAASVYYRSPKAPYTRFLQFWPLAESRMSATRALRVTVATHRNLPGFELRALHPTTRGAAELVYSYDSTRTGQRLTFIQRVFPAPDGKRYAFAVVGPAGEWPRQRVVLGTALQHFKPAED